MTLLPIALLVLAQTGRQPLGHLAQAIVETKIFAQPDRASHVFCTVKRNEYLVADSWNGGWDMVLLANGTYGFSEAKLLRHLPYLVTAEHRPSTAEQRSGPSAVASEALRYLGKPVAHDASGGQLVSSVLARFGKRLPQKVSAQLKFGSKVTRLEDLTPGDRLYFWSKPADDYGYTGIYLGGGYFLGPVRSLKTLQTHYLGKSQFLKILVAARHDTIAKTAQPHSPRPEVALGLTPYIPTTLPQREIKSELLGQGN